jgi:hypothetical protein
MKQILLLFVLSGFLSGAATAQTRLVGRVVNARGQSVEYVNVGIEDTQTGVVSDNLGNFSLTIPDSLASGTLFVSHITYEPRRIPLPEVLRRAQEPLTIELSERAFEIPPIVVHGGRPRYRRVSGGMRIPLPGTMYVNTRSGEVNTPRSSEIGTVLNIREPLLISEVSFPVKSSTDSLLMRINLYQIENDTTFIPLHNVPFYVLIEPEKTDWKYTVDVSEALLVARPGKVLVSFEKVEFRKDVFVRMPFHFGDVYRREPSDTGFRKAKIPAIGFQLYGRVLPE